MKQEFNDSYISVFENPGRKIKKIATILCILESVLIAIGCLVGFFVIVSDSFWLALLFLVLAPVSIFLIWFMYLLVYAFGDITETTRMIYQQQLGKASQGGQVKPEAKASEPVIKKIPSLIKSNNTYEPKQITGWYCKCGALNKAEQPYCPICHNKKEK